MSLYESPAFSVWAHNCLANYESNFTKFATQLPCGIKKKRRHEQSHKYERFTVHELYKP